MKRISILTVLVLTLMSLLSFAAPISSPILISPAPVAIAAGHDLIVNGVILKPTFFLQGDTVMIPLRAVSEALGYEVKWYSTDGHIELIKGARFIYVKSTDNYYAFGKMAPVKLTLKPMLIKGSAFVPLNFVTDLLDAGASHNDAGVIIDQNMDTNVQTGGFVITKIESEWIYTTLLGGEAHIRLTPETTFSEYGSSKALTVADLKVGDTLKVTHPNVMLAIYPPQYPAVHIEKLQNVVFRTGVISEIGEDWFMVDSFDNGIRINTSVDTVYLSAYGKEMTFKDLHIGNRVQVYHSMIATFSIPPQSPGFKVIVE